MTRAMRILNTAEKSAAVARCALICVVGLIAVARCALLRRVTGDCGYPTRQGVKKKVVQSLPKFAYADRSPSKWLASTVCAICLGDFDAGDEIRVLPQCGHGFHVGCIDTWLGSHSYCPSCRQVLAVAGGVRSVGGSRPLITAAVEEPPVWR